MTCINATALSSTHPHCLPLQVASFTGVKRRLDVAGGHGGSGNTVRWARVLRRLAVP